MKGWSVGKSRLNIGLCFIWIGEYSFKNNEFFPVPQNWYCRTNGILDFYGVDNSVSKPLPNIFDAVYKSSF